jgi:hypothetical protein
MSLLRSDDDSPWKEVLERYFEDYTARWSMLEAD